MMYDQCQQTCSGSLQDILPDQENPVISTFPNSDRDLDSNKTEPTFDEYINQPNPDQNNTEITNSTTNETQELS